MDFVKTRVMFPWEDLGKVLRLSKTKESIYARECDFVKVEPRKAKEFIEANHIQGWARCSVMLGLCHNGELVSIMTFGKPRYSKKADWELIRYCSIKKVVGGAERLLAHFIDEYKPKAIVSYCDKSKFDGRTYESLGFRLIRNNQPSKHWYKYETGEHYTDSLIRSHGFSRIIHHCEASEDNLDTNDNRQLMLDEGFVEVYDLGQATYLLEL